MAEIPKDQQFDVLVTNAVDIARMLADDKITSVQVVQQYFRQIDKYEGELNAFISPAPREKVLRAAAALDEERRRGNIRSPLHGIPIALKDCLTTASSLGMSNTCGSLAFVEAEASKNSAVVQRLLDAGLIIMGKTNMTEFCGMKMTMMMPGWSAHGGQTQSPYTRVIEEDEKILGHSAPGGSSTGSAVAVSAGFSPLAIGTETIGSIITPATRNALYALKPTVGVQDATGTYTMTEFYDSFGPMAKCAADVRALAAVMLGRDLDIPEDTPWEGLSVGLVDPKLWTLPEEMCQQHDGTAEQMADDYISAVSNLQRLGHPVKYPVAVPDASVLPDTIHLAHWEFKHIGIPRYIKAFDKCPVSSVEDIVNFNEANKERAMPNPYTEQNDLILAMNSNEDAKDMDRAKETLRIEARRILDTAFDENNVNLIAGPVDSAFCVHVAAAGYPIATIPVSTLRYNGRPFGMCVTARRDDERVLLQFQAAYEATREPRPVPRL